MNSGQLLHILVIGFHHKRGCTVEFSYPPLDSTEKSDCPKQWKYLPTLALPDGSHKFNKDSVFFNLPSLTEPHYTVYGISCYRQIPVEELKVRTADITRSTVQKSVTVLVTLPLFGYVEVKLELIAQTYFEQGDFASTDILIKAYNQLNTCLQCSDFPNSNALLLKQLHVGLPLRDIILKWRHKILIIFKMLLLQKRIICFGSPVRPITSLILGIVSLHPDVLEKGFHEVSRIPTDSKTTVIFDNLEEEILKTKIDGENNVEINAENKTLLFDDSANLEPKNIEVNVEHDYNEIETLSSGGSNLSRNGSVDPITTNLISLSKISTEQWNGPFPVFDDGYMCLPYLSLPYMDILSDPNVIGYIAGTSNILFQQKKQLADVLIDVETTTIDYNPNDQDFKKQIQLTTEDLRFMDYILRNVQNPKEDAEGSEVWIRQQFKYYVIALLRTSLCDDGCKEIEHFNGNFMNSFQKTHSYSKWLNKNRKNNNVDNIDIVVGHPFSGLMSVADVKLKIAQSMHNSESGRKINQAVNSTSRVFGGAISQAKGALSTWWSSITTNQALNVSESMINEHDNKDDKEILRNSHNHEDDNKNYEKDNEKIIIDENNRRISKISGIVEIAKEAELLDSNKQTTN